jgi:hypothetical protein
VEINIKSQLRVLAKNIAYLIELLSTFNNETAHKGFLEEK